MTPTEQEHLVISLKLVWGIEIPGDALAFIVRYVSGTLRDEPPRPISPTRTPYPSPAVTPERVSTPASSRPSVVPEPDPAIVAPEKPNPTRDFHLKSLPGGDFANWRPWVEGTQNASYKLARLGYALKHFAPDTPEAAAIQAAIDTLKTARSKGESWARATTTPPEQKDEVFEKVSALLAEEYVLPSDLSRVRPLHIFGQLLPTRRTGDLEEFYVRDVHDDSLLENSFSKRDQTFRFASYKNSKQYGIQTFTTEDVLSISPSRDRALIGIATLNAMPAGWRLAKPQRNLSKAFSRANDDLSVNAFRHHLATVARGYNKPRRILVNTWLCHNAETSLQSYEET